MDNELVEEVVLQVPGEALSSNGGAGGISGGKWWLAVTGVVGRGVGSSSTAVISIRCVERRALHSSNSSNSVKVFCLRRSPLL